MTIDEIETRPERILVAIDSEGQSTATTDYVGRIVAGNDKLVLCLYNRIPGLPPKLREHVSSRNPERETELGELQAEKVSTWRLQQQAESRTTLEAVRRQLTSAGISRHQIELETSWDASLGEPLAQALTRVAQENDCRTIAIRRQHLSGLQELLHHHTSDALVRGGTGIALWIVE